MIQARLFAALQYITPQHALSRLAGKLANSTWPPLKNTFIRWFIQRYGVDLAEAVEEDPQAYACFNDFFTRALKPGRRPIDEQPDSIVCPADGAVSQLGEVRDGRIFQAKGQLYTVQELLGGDEALADEFSQGHFCTLYLSPRDYHRVHMPYAGTLRQTVAVPGDLFSVNQSTAGQVPRLFSRNERLVAIFDTDVGPMAVVLVGAMIVSGIETVWDQSPMPDQRKVTEAKPSAPVNLDKGDEMGRFKLGSTAIVLFARDRARWSEAYQAETPTKMGQKLGTAVTPG